MATIRRNEPYTDSAAYRPSDGRSFGVATNSISYGLGGTAAAAAAAAKNEFQFLHRSQEMVLKYEKG